MIVAYAGSKESLVVTHDQLGLHLAHGFDGHADRDQDRRRGKGQAHTEGGKQEVGQGGQNGQEQSREQRQAVGSALEEVHRILAGTQAADVTALMYRGLVEDIFLAHH